MIKNDIIAVKDDNAKTFAKLFDYMLVLGNKIDAMDKRFDKIDTRLDALDKRFDKIDSRLDATVTRMDRLEVRLY